jgi:hypothetical protein
MMVYIGTAHWTKLPATQLVTSITVFSLTWGFQIFFPVAFYLLFTPWFCDPTTKVNFVIAESTDCFSTKNVISIIFGTFGTIALFVLAFFSSLIKSSQEPINNDFTVFYIEYAEHLDNERGFVQISVLFYYRLYDN